MKTELTDVSPVHKTLAFEIPCDVVGAEIARVTDSYSRTARVPGFRPGRVPANVVRQRYKDQILYDVAHDLIPRVVGEALRERGLDPIATPDVRDVVLEEGQPLTFMADFETLPAVEPGDCTGIPLRKPPAVLEVGAIDQALEHLRERAAKWIPIEDRASATGDTILLDLTRTVHPALGHGAGDAVARVEGKDGVKPETLQNVSVELGQAANPPGFDENLTGLSTGAQKAFTVTYPADYQVADLAGATVDYDVALKGIRRKELSPLDDDFAKEVSEFETLDALRERVKADLQHQAEHDADHQLRHELLQVLAGRLTGDVPSVLVEREVDRRLEDLVRRLMDQGLDPTKANIDWQDLRARQRQAAESAVRSALVLDAIARREQIVATDEDMAQEIERYAERTGRTPAAVRAPLEKEGGLGRIAGGIQREKTMAWLIERANVSHG
jgi:trigger factor